MRLSEICGQRTPGSSAATPHVFDLKLHERHYTVLELNGSSAEIGDMLAPEAREVEVNFWSSAGGTGLALATAYCLDIDGCKARMRAGTSASAFRHTTLQLGTDVAHAYRQRLERGRIGDPNTLAATLALARQLVETAAEQQLEK